MHNKVEPVKQLGKHGGDTVERFEHDAFGTISMSTQSGGSGVLFGSDIQHGQRVSIRISRANLTRNLSNDWIHPSSTPLVEVHLSFSQFAEFITSNGKASGIPCTLAYAPARGTPTEIMPGIDKLETKADTFRKEIKNSAAKQMDKVMKSLVEIEKMLEGGTAISKKGLREAVHAMRCQISNTPDNMAFVIAQAEEALEKAVTASKIEVESYINSAIGKLGLEAAKEIGLVKEGSTFLIEGTTTD